MPWILLIIAGLFEVAWAVALKSSQGLTRFWPTVWFFLAMLVSVWLLGLAMRHLPMGTAYAVWTGIGAVGAVLLGILFFGESPEWRRLLCVGLILSGLLGLKLLDKPEAGEAAETAKAANA